MDGMYPQARLSLEDEEGELPVSDPSTDIVKDRADAVAYNLEQPREDVARAEDRVATSSTDGHKVPVRIYWPTPSVEVRAKRAAKPGEDPPSPAIIHLHGGGFVFNDIEVHDGLARRLANRSGMVVVSVGYRRAPEDRFPAAQDDVDVVVEWVRGRAAQLGVDADKILLHGDSAGASLALVAALRNPGVFSGMALIYPFIDASLAGASWDTATGLFDRSEGAWYWAQYASGPQDYDNPDFSPALATDLSGLPPTMVLTAEFDPCRDEGELFALRAADAGVRVTASRALGLLHGFYRHFDEFDAAEPTLRQVAGFLTLCAE